MIFAAFILRDKSPFAMRFFFNHNYKETNCLFWKIYLKVKYKKGIWLFNVSEIENLAIMFRKQFVSVRAGMGFLYLNSSRPSVYLF